VELHVTLQIGKEGPEKVMEEAERQLKKRGKIKVKVNRNIVEGRQKEFTQKIAEQLARKLDAEVVWVRGRTFVLRRGEK